VNLRELAEQDLGVILEDDINGFGWSINLTNPQEIKTDDVIDGGLKGYSNDISQTIDPETGQVVSGRSASVSIRMSTLLLNGFTLPVGIANTTLKPWLVTFNDINGSSHTFKVAQSNPDRTLGIITLILEFYK